MVEFWLLPYCSSMSSIGLKLVSGHAADCFACVQKDPSMSPLGTQFANSSVHTHINLRMPTHDHNRSASPFWKTSTRDQGLKRSATNPPPSRDPNLVVGAAYSHADMLKIESLYVLATCFASFHHLLSLLSDNMAGN